MHSRLFADLSSNNNEFNAQQYRNAGGIFVAIKASEGTSYVNPDHHAWCIHATIHHIGIAHYHFARPDLSNDPEAEARHFLATALPLAGGRDYLVLDSERGGPGNVGIEPAFVNRFDDYVRAHSRFSIILYASRSTLQASGAWLEGSRKKRVWDAAYSNEPDFAPQGFVCVMRQFTDGIVGPEPHSLPGVGRCDVNRMSSGFFNVVASKAR